MWSLSFPSRLVNLFYAFSIAILMWMVIFAASASFYRACVL